MMPWAGMASLPSVRRTNPATSTARTRLRRSSTSRQRAAAAVEGHEVGRQARVLAVAGREPRIVPERLGVGREQIRRRARTVPARNSLRISSGETPKRKTIPSQRG